MKHLFILLFTVLLASCDDSNNTQIAKKFNDDLVQSNMMFERKITPEINKMILQASLGKMELMQAICNKTLAMIDDHQKKLDSITTPKIPQAKEFKEGYVNLLQLNRRAVELCLELFETKTEKERLEVAKRLNHVVESSKQAEYNISDYQRKYAEFYGATVQENP
jgi:hypothetical protein